MPVTKHQTTSTDGTTIVWYDHQGNGPDLLLGHATGFCGRMWEPVIDSLQTKFRCITYDIRGHGLSGHPKPEYGTERYDWNRFADDVSAVIEDAQLVTPFAVGHSSGGATELLIEERSPGMFQSMVLFEPVIFAVDPPAGPDPERELAIRTRRRKTRFESREDAKENFTSRGPFAGLDPRSMDAYLDYGFLHHEDGSIELRCRPDDEAEVYVMASDHRGYVELGRVTCPVQILHGSESKSFSFQDMQAVVERLPNGSLMEMESWGHFGPLEHPDEFAQVIVELLS